MPIKFSKETSSRLFRYVKNVDIRFNRTSLFQFGGFVRRRTDYGFRGSEGGAALDNYFVLRVVALPIYLSDTLFPSSLFQTHQCKQPLTIEQHLREKYGDKCSPRGIIEPIRI